MEKNSEKDFGPLILIHFLYFSILVILLFSIIYLGYFVYLNFPGDPRNFEIANENYKNEAEIPTLQFHPNMKFNHNDISYYVYPDCNIQKAAKIKQAFEIMSKEIPVSFYPVSENPDIEIICSEKKSKMNDEPEKRYFIAGEGGAKEIIKSGNYNVITNGTIFLYKNPFKIKDCNIPVIEIHEILHVFGFDHLRKQDSLMNPYLETCIDRIDIPIIEELKRLYSIENLPDLSFENIRITKRGRYLDFNLTIKNIGLSYAENVSFSIFDENKLLETRDAGTMDYGSGIFIQVKNLRLINRNSKKITFIINNKSLLKEINKNNNVVEIKIED